LHVEAEKSHHFVNHVALKIQTISVLKNIETDENKMRQSGGGVV